MFIAHFGVAFAAKRVEPKVNLAIYFIAAQLIDLLWPVFIILGWESVSPLPEKMGMNTLQFDLYPYTHSLPGMTIWSLLLAGVIYGFTRSRRQSAIVLLVALSHWFLDLLVHEPDLPLLGNNFKVGFALWRSVPISLALEVGLFSVGLLLYIQKAGLRSKGRYASLLGLALLMLAIYLGSVFGPVPPPETTAVQIGAPALLMWLFVIWAYFLDRKST